MTYVYHLLDTINCVLHVYTKVILLYIDFQWSPLLHQRPTMQKHRGHTGTLNIRGPLTRQEDTPATSSPVLHLGRKLLINQNLTHQSEIQSITWVETHYSTLQSTKKKTREKAETKEQNSHPTKIKSGIGR